MAISYYPRLNNAYAMTLISEYSLVESPADLTRFAETSHPMAYHDHLATEVVSAEHLNDLRSQIVSVANQLGFPEKLARTRVREFDQPVADILYQEMELIPAEAANPEIWNFLTLILLPDIAAWRYPNSDRRVDFERWLGVERNIFRKLWWREATLGKELNSKIGEDEAVGIMERPGLSGNPAVARAIVTVYDDIYAEFSHLARSDMMRLVMTNVRRLAPIIDYEFYDEKELSQLLVEIVRDACKQYENKTEQSRQKA